MIDRRVFYDGRAPLRAAELGRTYHRLIQQYFKFLVPPGSRVLEIGCGLGDLLAAVSPAKGVGVDFSARMIERARQRHPELEFWVSEATEFTSMDRYDYILLSDLINDVPDVQVLFQRMHIHAHIRSRLIVNFFNTLWRPVLGLAEKLGIKAPLLPQSWLSAEDVQNLLYLSGWEVVKTDHKILWPAPTPIWSRFINRWLSPLPLLRHLCLTIFQVARPARRRRSTRDYSCSVVIPARNEAGTVEATIVRVPDMGRSTEILLVEGHSKDETWEEAQRAAVQDRRLKVIKQKSRGKGGAVREGFAAAAGEILFILDADLTVPPEELAKCYEVLRSGAADLVNGVRLVYPVPPQGMRFCNMVANKLFSLCFSWLLGQPIKDTLCGTKVLFRADYERIVRQRACFGDFDPFGDFELLLGAAKLNLRIVDLPVRYQARIYGQTNIRRWRDGLFLLRMTVFAARRLKFI